MIAIELTALRTHPEDLRKVLRRKGPFELSYAVNQNEKGEIIDYDQGVKFGSRQEYVDAMFDNDEPLSVKTDFW